MFAQTTDEGRRNNPYPGIIGCDQQGGFGALRGSNIGNPFAALFDQPIGCPREDF